MTDNYDGPAMAKQIIRLQELNARYREALTTLRQRMVWMGEDSNGLRHSSAGKVARDCIIDIDKALMPTRQGCTCSLAAAGHDKHCAMRTSDERKETPTERAERAYQMQQEMRKANARVREVIAKSSSKSNGANDGK